MNSQKTILNSAKPNIKVNNRPVLFYGFSDSTCIEIRRSLGDNAEFISIGEKPPFPSVCSWSQLAKNIAKPWDHSICDELEFIQVLSHHRLLTECYSRHYYYNHSAGPPAQGYDNIIRSHYSLCKSFFFRKKPSAIFFSNIPHEGFDNLLQIVANINHIPTYACFQLPFAPRFFCLHLSTDASTTDGNLFAMERMIEAHADESSADEDVVSFIQKLLGHGEYSYMSDLSPHPILPSVGNPIKSFIGRACRLELKGAYNSVKSFGGAILAWQRYKKYRQLLLKHVGPKPTSYTDQDYIYVPLHLQPELTTSALGSIYVDQTIALSIASKLAHMTGCKVLCKDNPKQSYPYRSPFFFETCEAIKNLYFVDASTSSRDLIINASLTITVTGTAGLEAVAMGVPVYCLGDAWWKTVAGVAKTFEEAYLSIKKQRKLHQFKHKRSISSNSAIGLRKDLNRLANASYSGCSDPDYCQEFSSCEIANSEILAKSLSGIVARLGA